MIQLTSHAPKIVCMHVRAVTHKWGPAGNGANPPGWIGVNGLPVREKRARGKGDD